MKKKSLLSLLLFLLYCFSVVSCSAFQSNPSNEMPMPPPEDLSVLEQVERYPADKPYFQVQKIDLSLYLPEGVNIEKIYHKFTPSHFYIMVNYADSNAEIRYQNCVLVYDRSMTYVKTIDLTSILSHDLNIRINTVLSVSDTGDIALLVRHSETKDLYIFTINSDGTEILDQKKLNLSPAVEGETNRQHTVVHRNKSGLIFILGSSKYNDVSERFVQVYDPDGNFLFDLSGWKDNPDLLWDSIGSITVDEDQAYLYCTKGEQVFFVPILVDEQRLGETIASGNKKKSLAIIQNHLYKSNDTGMYRSDLNGDNPETLFLWEELDMGVYRSIDEKIVGAVSDNELFFSVFLSSAEYNRPLNYELYFLSRQESNPHANKIILDLGGYSVRGHSEILDAIVEYNLTNDHYYIRYNDYSKHEDYIAAPNLEEKMIVLEKLLSETNPVDIIMNLPEASYKRLEEKILLADITQIAKEDESFDTEDYLSFAVQSITENKSTYSCLVSYGLYGVVMKEDTFPDKNPQSISDLSDLIESQSVDFRKLQGISSEELFSTILLFTQVNNSSIRSLDSEELRDILLFCKDYGASKEYVSALTFPPACGNCGPIYPPTYFDQFDALEHESLHLLFQTEGIHPLYWRLLWNTCGGDITLTGLPVGSQKQEDTTSVNHVIAYPVTTAAIVQSSPFKRAALDFIEVLSTHRSYGDYYLSIRKETILDTFTDKLYNLSSHEQDLFSPLSEDDVSVFYRLANRIETIELPHLFLFNISKAAQNYFDGTEDLDEAVQSIEKAIEAWESSS